MKHNRLLLIGFFCGLLATPAVATENGKTPVAGADEAAVGKQAEGGVRATDAGAERSAGSTVGGDAKPAGTATAAGYVYDQVKKGNVKIEGATDTEVPEF